MKKGLCLLLSFVFLLSCMPFVVFANDTGETEETDVISNVALNESALAYSSSEKNTLWTPAAALNDGKYSKDTWQGWEVGYPEIIYGSDTSAGFSGQYYGIKFRNSEYYEISNIYINMGLHAAMGGQNAHFVVQCLVEGVWVTVKEFSDSDTKPLDYDTYEDAMANDTSFYHIPAEISFDLETPVTTNNVRVTLSNYGKNYPGGDVLIFPYVYEIELNGKRGVTPDLELPEGAIVSTNIGYHSYPEASSSTSYRYPYCAIDGKVTSYWSPRGKNKGEYLSLVFNESKKINKAVINFGEYLNGMSVVDYAFDIEALIDGDWVKVASGTAFDEENESFITEYSFADVDTEAIRVVFTESYQKAPAVYEFEAHLSNDKTYYVEDRFDVYERSSASKGNIAIIAQPYANLDFAPYSDVNYIVDGKIGKDDYVWFTGVIDMPSYCGIKFDKKQVIDRVALYFYIPEVEGIDIMSIQIQAKIDGEYVTLINTKSYHEELKYSPAFKFDPVETDDIRILYTAGNGTFAHLKEIEAYSPNGCVPMFDGLVAMEDTPEFIDCTSGASQSTSNNENQVGTPKAEEMIYVSENSVLESADNEEANIIINENNLTSENNTVVIASVIIGAGIMALLVAAIAFAIVKKRKLN